MSETYSRVRVGKNLSNMFPIRNGLKQGDALSPLLFNFALDCAIRRVQVNQDGLKLNGTHHLLADADDNILRGSVHTVKENAEALVVATREIGLEVNADETKYMIMSRDQNAGRSHSMKTDNRSIKRATFLGHIFKKLCTACNTRLDKTGLKTMVVCENICLLQLIFIIVPHHQTVTQTVRLSSIFYFQHPAEAH